MHKQPIGQSLAIYNHHRHSMDPICTNNQSHTQTIHGNGRVDEMEDDESVGIRNNANVGDERRNIWQFI